MKKLLLFDFDGVIVNTLDMILSVKRDLNQAITKEEYVKLFHGNIFKGLEKVQERNYTKLDQDKFFNLYSARLLDLSPTPGIIDVIRELSKNNRLIIISSTLNNPIEQYLQKHNIDNLIDGIYGADVNKSKVRKIRMSLDEHDTTSENSIYITDTLGDIKESREAGVDSIAVSWGFHDPETLASGNPKYLVNTPEELLQKVEEFITK